MKTCALGSRRNVPAGSGFTVAENVVVLAIVLLLAVLTMPDILRTVRRQQLIKTLERTAAVMRLARFTAVQQQRDVIVRADLDTGELLAFVNVDQDPEFELQEGEGSVNREQDYRLANVSLGPENGVFFWGPADERPGGPDSIEGFTESPWGTVAVFRSDGAVIDTGAFRIADHHGNFMELRVASTATGRVEFRKYHPEPPWGDPPGFFPRGRSVVANMPLWRWF